MRVVLPIATSLFIIVLLVVVVIKIVNYLFPHSTKREQPKPDAFKH